MAQSTIRADTSQAMTPQLPKPPRASSAAVRAVMMANRKTDTAPERALRSALHGRGLRYRIHARLDDVACQVDVVFLKARVAVFVDGCFWHRCPHHGVRPRTNSHYWDAKIDRNVARDRQNTRDLENAGWTVVRVWEHEAPEEAAERISRLVRSRLTQRPDQPNIAGPPD
jgi:DNA mismatch endonuclease, patch repair protein